MFASTSRFRSPKRLSPPLTTATSATARSTSEASTPNNVNVRAILEALKTAPEGEFVTVQQNDSDVHVAKEHGQLVVHVIDKNSKEKVDVTIPWEVAQALIADTTENQLNIEAAIKALENLAGDVNLVSVVGHDETVRIWIDSRSSDE